MALKNSTAAARAGETVPIESPVRASKSNGTIGECSQNMAGAVEDDKALCRVEKWQRR